MRPLQGKLSVKSLPVRCRSGITPLSPLCDYKALAHDPHCILPSALFCHRSLPSPLTGQAAQPPEFSPHDVVGLAWSPLAIRTPSRLAAPIRPFLEPNFPRRWPDSDVGVDTPPSQPGRSPPNPAPGLLPFFPSTFLNGLSERSASLPPAADIEIPYYHGYSPRF
jgi:hypothetical protein